ncbi:MAG: desulfoferrodoxin family protein [Deltaproteobacteria bacterium]
MRRINLFLTVLLLVVGALNGVALADKAAATIEGPVNAARGSEVTLKVTVTHSANSALHHTEWLKVTANDKEIARWNYTSSERPDGAVFTKEVKVKVLETMEVKAEASCNVHGSKGPSTLKITVKE